MNNLSHQERLDRRIANGEQAAADVCNWFRPAPALAHVVREIWDVDLPEIAEAREFTLTAWTSSAPVMALQYRGALHCERHFNGVSVPHPAWRHIAIKHQSGVSVMRTPGPTGVILVLLQPQMAERILSAPTRDFMDVKVNLSDIFGDHALSLLEEALAEATSGAERISVVERFLLERVGERKSNAVVERAMSCLLANPSLPIRKLADALDISERQLLRSFQVVVGMPPKQFARVARLEHAIVARREGASWAEAAYACGFSDQPHLIKDFGAVLGNSPEKMFRLSRADEWGKAPMTKAPFFPAFAENGPV